MEVSHDPRPTLGDLFRDGVCTVLANTLGRFMEWALADDT